MSSGIEGHGVSGGAVDQAIAGCVPTVLDGAKGIRFVEAAVESNTAGGSWVPAAMS